MNNVIQFGYPFHFDSRGRTASASYEDHVRDLIEQLLLTDPGERVNRPDFGSGLRQLTFAPNSPELAAALQFTINANLQRWLNDVIDVQSLDVTAQDSTLTVNLKYVIRATGQTVTQQLQRPA